MTKAKLIAEAKKVLSKWTDIENDMRHEDGENWHCVNVKRHGDYINDKELNALITGLTKNKEEQNHLKNWYEELEDTDRFYYIYNFWLEQAWYFLEEGLVENDRKLEYISLQGEIVKEDYKTRCDKCYRKTWYEDEQPCHVSDCTGTLKKITHNQVYDNRKAILALGRSGGWACFQMTTDGHAEEIESKLEYIDDKDTDKEELERYVEELKETIEEVEYVKDYIERFNNDLKWADEIQYRMEEQLEEIRKEIADEKSGKTLKDSIFSLACEMEETIQGHNADKTLKQNIKRNVNSIKRLIEN